YPPFLHCFPTRRSSDLSYSLVGKRGALLSHIPVVDAFENRIKEFAQKIASWKLPSLSHKFILRDPIGICDVRVLGDDYLAYEHRSEEHTSELQSLRHLV